MQTRAEIFTDLRPVLMNLAVRNMRTARFINTGLKSVKISARVCIAFYRLPFMVCFYSLGQPSPRICDTVRVIRVSLGNQPDSVPEALRCDTSRLLGR